MNNKEAMAIISEAAGKDVYIKILSEITQYSSAHDLVENYFIVDLRMDEAVLATSLNDAVTMYLNKLDEMKKAAA